MKRFALAVAVLLTCAAPHIIVDNTPGPPEVTPDVPPGWWIAAPAPGACVLGQDIACTIELGMFVAVNE